MYMGYMAGIQAGYQFNSLLGVSLTADYAHNKAGARDYAADYLLARDGMTYYTPQPFTTERYGDLYAGITMISAGLHVNINCLRIFGSKAAGYKFRIIASPAVYAQHFSSKVYTKADNEVYAGERLGKNISIGLGGDVAVCYDMTTAIALQLKGTGIWITDNLFDHIATIGYAKHNAVWSVSAGVIWKFSK
jgi:hypothetical protein